MGSLAFPTGINNQDTPYLKIVMYKYKLPDIGEDEKPLPVEDIGEDKEKKKVLTSIERENTLATISLPAPPGFGESISTGWSEENVIPSLSDLPNALASNMGKGILTAADALLGEFSASASISANMGGTIRPNTMKVFKSPGTRSFPFSYTFTPRDKKEGEAMMNIVETLRKGVIPDVQGLTSGISANYYYKFPPIFDIYIMPPSDISTSVSEDTYLTKYMAMALVSFDVKYSEGTEVFSYYDGGVPANISLTLSFESLLPLVNMQTGFAEQTADKISSWWKKFEDQNRANTQATTTRLNNEAQ